MVNYFPKSNFITFLRKYAHCASSEFFFLDNEMDTKFSWMHFIVVCSHYIGKITHIYINIYRFSIPRSILDLGRHFTIKARVIIIFRQAEVLTIKCHILKFGIQKRFTGECWNPNVPNLNYTKIWTFGVSVFGKFGFRQLGF